MRALRWLGGILAGVVATYLAAVFASLLPPPNEFAAYLTASLGPPPDTWDPMAGDSPRQEDGMHACPPGTALAAVGGDNNFLCRAVTGNATAVTTRISRAARQVDESHACPVGFYLRGMNAAESRFLCSHDPTATVSEAIHQREPPNCSSGEVAVGFNQLQRKILCASIGGRWRLSILRYLVPA